MVPGGRPGKKEVIMPVLWNVIDCENQDRDFVDQSQPDYDIAGNTWTFSQTPVTLTEASTSVTRTNSYAASNTITLENSVYGDVWGGVFRSTGTERKQSGTPVSDFTHKDSSVSLKARGGFSASDGSDADDVLGFKTVELEGSSIDVAMGGNFSASGKGAFRVDQLLTPEEGLSLDGMVNTDILAWFGNNSLSINIDSTGSSFQAIDSDVHDALVGYESVAILGSLDCDSDATQLILGGKTSLSADVTLKEAVNASGIKFTANASAGISVKSIGSAELYDADAEAVIGYSHLVLGGDAEVDAAIGGNLDVKLTASGNATVVEDEDTTTVSYAEGSASLSVSLKSTGDAAVFGGYADVGLLAGYQQVSIAGSDADAIIGGNLTIDVKGGVELANLNTEAISDLSLDNLGGLLGSLQSANLSAGISLKSTGQVELTSYTPVLQATSSGSSDSVSLAYSIDEYCAEADFIAGYENFYSDQNSEVGVVIGGNLSLSLDAGADIGESGGSIDAKLTGSLQSKGLAQISDSDVDALIGYKTLEVEFSDLGVVVGGNINLTVKGGYDFSNLLELDPVSASLISTGSASLVYTYGDALVGYRDVTLTGSAVSVIVGGNVSGDLDAVIELGALAFSANLSLQSKATGTLTLDGSGGYADRLTSDSSSISSGLPMTSTEFALGYQNVVISDSWAGVVIGGNLNVGITVDYPSPFDLVGAVSLTSLGQATVSNSSVTALVGYRDLSMTGSSVGVAVAGNINVALGFSQEEDGMLGTFGLSFDSKGQASLTQSEASALIGYQTLSLNASGVGVGVGGSISVVINAEIPQDDAASFSLTAFLDSKSSATLINGSEADVLIGYRNLNVNASTIGSSFGGNSSLVAAAVLTPVEESEDSLLDVSAKLSVKAAGTASITNRSTVGTLIGYKTVTIERNSTAGDIIGGELSGTASMTGYQVSGEELNSFFSGILGGISAGSFGAPMDSPIEEPAEMLFNGTWKSTGSVAVTGGTVEGIFGYSKVTLNYVDVGSANGGNYTFTDAPLSSFDLDDEDTCQVSAAGTLTGTELNIDDITGFKKIQMTGGSVSGAVSATSSATNDWAARQTVFSALDVDFSGCSTLSGYSKVTVDGTYGSTMAMVMTTDGRDTFTLQGNAGLYVETMLFGAGNDKLQITGDSTMYIDTLNFGDGYDVLDVASGSQLNFYGCNIDGLEKITGKGTVVVTDEALAEALRQLTNTATIVYNPSLAPAGFSSALSLESDAAYNLDAGTALDTLATAATSALFDEEQKSSVLGAMIA